MPEFCTCGSIIIGGQCTNKNCAFKSNSKVETKSASGKKANSAKKEPKTPKTRRSSKCITYNLYDIKKEEDTE